MTENAHSILIVIFSVQLQQTETSDRKLFIFHLGKCLFIFYNAFSLRLTETLYEPKKILKT